MKSTDTFLTCLVMLSALAGNVRGQETNRFFHAEMTLAQPPFHQRQWETTVNSGVMFSPFVVVKNRPTVDYAMAAVQAGRMITDPAREGWARGNFELAGEAFGGGIFDGAGDYLSGMTLWLRYNMLPEGWRVVPFVQAGAGVMFTDADRHLIGQDFNFNLEVGVGARYMLSDRWSINLEYRFQHISNANMAQRNVGINAQGVMLGVSRFF
jgi:lipid A 3-O-deacylase